MQILRGSEKAMKQQHFLPACKGVVKNMLPSLIPDGSFQESNNVMFGEGCIEKAKGSLLYSDVLSARIAHIGLFEPVNALPMTTVFTVDNVYSLNNSSKVLASIMPDTYGISGARYISDCTVEKDYIFTNMVNDIYAWDGITASAHKLYGTYKPADWKLSTAYVLGDTVKPTDSNYNGFIYKCTTAGTSGAVEPTWATSNESFTDGTCHWTLCGGLEIEGNSATSLRAKNIVYFKGFTVLANTEEDGTSYPQRIRWAQWNNCTLWHNNTDGSGLAGYVDCTDGADPVMNIKVFGEYLVVYKQNSIQIISYTGDTSTTFERAIVSTEVGLLAPRGIIATPNLHIFVGADNIYTFNLNTATAIGDPIRTEFFRLVDPSKRDRILGYYNKDYPEMMFIFHSIYNKTDQPDMALTYNPMTKAWGFIDFNYSAIGQMVLTDDVTIDNTVMTIDEMADEIDNALNQQSSAVTFLGDINGNLFIRQGYTDFRKDYEGYVITKTHHMEEPERLKRLMRVQFHMESGGDYDLVVQIGYSNIAETQMSWTSPVNLRLSSLNPPWIDCDVTARYFAIKFGTKLNAQPFKVLGYTLFYNDRSVQ